jgi:hypothetical protein
MAEMQLLAKIKPSPVYIIDDDDDKGSALGCLFVGEEAGFALDARKRRPPQF